MDYNIIEYIEQLMNKKREIVSIEEEIENKRKTFEQMIQPLVDNYERRKNELFVLFQMLVPVRLGDLLDELAWLAGIKVSDIYVEIETGYAYYGKYNIFEMLQLINSCTTEKCKSNNNEIELDLFGCGENYSVTCKPIFEYYTNLSLDLNEIQSDGTRLIEHCDIKYEYDLDGRVYTKIIINYDIENIICNFNLEHIVRTNNKDWYPADLFTQAIINCVLRDYNFKVDKIRERVKNKN